MPDLTDEQFQLELVKRLLDTRMHLLECTEQVLKCDYEKRLGEARIEAYKFMIDWTQYREKLEEAINQTPDSPAIQSPGPQQVTPVGTQGGNWNA